MWAYKGVNVHWLGHDSVVLAGSKTVIIDPFKAQGNFKADVLLISHEHFDHLSEDDIKRFSGPTTTIVAPKICEEGLKKFPNEKKWIAPGARLDVKGVTLETIPAYNTNKFREPGKVFHPKGDGKLGFVLTVKGVRIYHTGDSDHIPEMRGIRPDVALVPVSGTYVMTSHEAAESVASIDPKVVIPMHYGAIVGDRKDAEAFQKLVKCEVKILEKES